MESTSKSTIPADDPELDLYTIPASSSWFSWDSIHETERTELREFFDGSSYTRSPKIYKEYRDFIISRYREEPSRRLTFTDLRKSLVGDVCLLRKVFNFLEKWGLINFNTSSSSSSPPSLPADGAVDAGVWKVRVEDGPPVGVKVVAAPTSVKPLVPPPPPVPLAAAQCRAGSGLVGDSNGFKLPPLASYSDVYGELAKGEGGLVCGACKESCESKYYVCAKDNNVLCPKCFENGSYGENKSADDYEAKDLTKKDSDQSSSSWTDTETLLLLESILKHGDDWELVTQNVKTKTKQECISRLIEMPFGELMLGSHGKVSSKGTVDVVVNDAAEEVKSASKEPEESKGTDDAQHDLVISTEQNGEAESHSPQAKKKRRITSSDPAKPLMEQVALISEMAGAHVQSAALSGAVSALCDGNALVAQIFHTEDDGAVDAWRSGNMNSELQRAIMPAEDSEMNQMPGPSGVDETSPSKDGIPLVLRMRAGVATALGAAAAHARLLAHQEEREIEYLVATVIETQLKKMRSKLKHVERLESTMEKEYTQLLVLEESIIAERMAVLRKILSAGISRWRDHVPMKSQPSNSNV